MAVKIDMQKAYDHLEWGFILKVLKCFGYFAKCIQLISQCISTMMYYVLLNGTPHCLIRPQ